MWFEFLLIRLSARKSQLTYRHKQNAVEILFKKIDGNERRMTCTLQENMLPELNFTTTKKKKENDNIITVWDLHKESFRSFRFDSLINWTILKDGYEL